MIACAYLVAGTEHSAPPPPRAQAKHPEAHRATELPAGTNDVDAAIILRPRRASCAPARSAGRTADGQPPHCDGAGHRVGAGGPGLAGHGAAVRPGGPCRAAQCVGRPATRRSEPASIGSAMAVPAAAPLTLSYCTARGHGRRYAGGGGVRCTRSVPIQPATASQCATGLRQPARRACRHPRSTPGATAEAARADLAGARRH